MSPKVFISLCLNVGLGVLYFFITRPGVERERAEPRAVNSSFTKLPIGPSVVTITNGVKPEFKWSQLETTDYQEYIRRLRAVGCPEATIRDIILADLDNVYEPKLNKLRGINPVAATEPYWLVSRAVPKPKPSPEAEKEIKALMEERTALVKELLGVTEKSIRSEFNWYEDAAQSKYSFLTPEQGDKVMTLEKKVDELRKQAPSNPSGSAVAKMQEEEFEKFRRKEMAEFMSPQEIYEYELRTSKLTAKLQDRFQSIEVNETEFRALYEYARMEEESRRGLLPGEVRSPEKAKEIAELRRKIEEGAREVVGPERVAELERFDDPGYRQLIAAAPYLGYDKAAAIQVNNMQTDARKAAMAIVNNPALTPEAKARAMQEISQATDKAVGQTIGERGLKYYKRKGGLSLPRIPSAPAQP
jgi:hypothetical protein